MRELLSLKLWLANKGSSDPCLCLIHVKLTSWGLKPFTVQSSWIQEESSQFCFSRIKPSGTLTSRSTMWYLSTVGGGMIRVIVQLYWPESNSFVLLIYNWNGCDVLNLGSQFPSIVLLSCTSYVQTAVPPFFHWNFTLSFNLKGEGQGMWTGMPWTALTISSASAEPPQEHAVIIL